MSDAQPSLWSRIQEPSLPRAIIATALFGVVAAGAEIAMAKFWPGNRIPLTFMAILGAGLGWVAAKIADANSGYSGPIMLVPVAAAIGVGIVTVGVAMGLGWIPGHEGMKTAFGAAGGAFAIGAMGTIAVDVAR